MGLQPQHNRGIGRERHPAHPLGVVGMAVPGLRAWPHALRSPGKLADPLHDRVCRLGLDSRPRLPALVQLRLSRIRPALAAWLTFFAVLAAWPAVRPARSEARLPLLALIAYGIGRLLAAA